MAETHALADWPMDEQQRFATLAQRYLDDELDMEQTRELSTAVQSRQECGRLFVDVALQRRLFVRIFHEQPGIRRTSAAATPTVASKTDLAAVDSLLSALTPAELSALERHAKSTTRSATQGSRSSAAQSSTGGSPLLGFLTSAFESTPVARVLLVLLAGCGLLLVGRVWQESEPTPVATVPAVAYLMAESDCRFEAADLSIGAALEARRLELHSGVAQIDMGGGAHLWLEGPSELELRSSGRVYLAQGRLLAHVPRHAVGFTVETDAGEVVDLGTEFAVDVAGGETSVAVTRGEVDLATIDRAPADGTQTAPSVAVPKRMRLTAGQAMLVARGADGTVTAKADPAGVAWVDHLARLPERLPEQVVAFQPSPESAVGTKGNYHAAFGLDFDVKRPIRVMSLGVFDDLGDGINPESKLTVQLWSRDDHSTPGNPADDTGGHVLAETTFDAAAPGALVSGQRFKPLARAIELAPGSYTIVASGFSPKNRNLNLNFNANVSLKAETSGDAITTVLASRYRENGAPGAFPSSLAAIPACYIAGSFGYVAVGPGKPD